MNRDKYDFQIGIWANRMKSQKSPQFFYMWAEYIQIWEGYRVIAADFLPVVPFLLEVYVSIYDYYIKM